ncbi:RsmB/NOP family class I SAM-dependent RNA methyltransferase [Cutibacterium sp.]|uniref:RsmB/NOP family class I SAM-dependent RNA methyltransferase n=1 Tax=Cutibacterium sp. TaxID=1912221 RepID=UPI0026DB2DF8|nr:transcription antitermination factor NusB [Cutibacterium sp.]MDO4411997.1 transcription antitermination factor NusB [Cutibacterium sp.]
MSQRHGQKRRKADPARRVAYTALLAVETRGSYANLALADQLRAAGMTGRDAAFATELVDGTSRGTGTWDRIVAAASGRDPAKLQPGVRVILRMAAHQILAMRVPTRAAVASSVDLAGQVIGERVTGLVNAVSRRISTHSLEEWASKIGGDKNADVLALRTLHPIWIVKAFQDRLGTDEVEAALLADNDPPVPTLVVRPGLADRQELLVDGGTATPYSPWGVVRLGNPADLDVIRQGRAGVQDEGSQLVVLALLRAAESHGCYGQWLDLCAGPGGKAALLASVAAQHNSSLTAIEIHQHRAELVEKALAPIPGDHRVLTADGTNPPLPAQSCDVVLADVPCSGLGSLRRRPESRWRRTPADIRELTQLQRRLLTSAVDLTKSGGVIGYVTCSPHRDETLNVIDFAQQDFPVDLLDAPAMIPEVPDIDDGSGTIQLWPHRHGTDGMFCALFRKRDS